MKRLVVLAAIAMVAGCTDDTAARRTLEAAGFSDVVTTGYDLVACGQDDFSSTGFRARNPQGRVVTGVVCCGLVVKACTIRF